MDSLLLIGLGIFISVLTLLVTLRVRSGNRLEVKNTEIILSLIPVVFFLLFTGRIDSLEIGQLKIESAFMEASRSPIAPQITELRGLPVTPVRATRKGSVSKIPRLIESRAQALRFRMGHGGYWGPAIQDYLVELSAHPYLRFVVINRGDGTLWGVVPSEDLVATLESRTGLTYERFAAWLNSESEEAPKALRTVILAKEALTDASDKSEALGRMEDLNLEFLPVVNKKNRFVGIVERSRLTASLIIDVAQVMKGAAGS